MKSCFVSYETMHAAGVPNRVIVYLIGSGFWMSRMGEVGTEGPVGLVPSVPQAAAGEFRSSQMENECERRPILVRS